KGVDGESGWRAIDGQLLAAVDVPETDRRVGRGDADRRDVAGVGSGDGLHDRAAEATNIRDHVVGGERADDHAGFAVVQDGGRQSDGRRRVLRFALQYDVVVEQAGQLLFDRRAVRASGDHHDSL